MASTDCARSWGNRGRMAEYHGPPFRTLSAAGNSPFSFHFRAKPAAPIFSRIRRILSRNKLSKWGRHEASADCPRSWRNRGQLVDSPGVPFSYPKRGLGLRISRAISDHPPMRGYPTGPANRYPRLDAEMGIHAASTDCPRPWRNRGELVEAAGRPFSHPGL